MGGTERKKKEKRNKKKKIKKLRDQISEISPMCVGEFLAFFSRRTYNFFFFFTVFGISHLFSFGM